MPQNTLQPPEQHSLPPTTHVPNSRLPVLIYRSVLPSPQTPESVRTFIESNLWKQEGPVWGHYPAHHFHSVTHECYAVIKGSSRLLLGRGPLEDETESGQEVDLGAGDVIVLPVCHTLQLILLCGLHIPTTIV
jgi:uncharacterized protein YjlB